MERAESKDTITLRRLEDAARAMSCQLVYAIVPYQGNFEGQAIEWVKRYLWRKKAERKRKRKLALAMAAVEKSEGQQGSPLAKQRLRRLVEAIREKVKEEEAAR